jgi:biotin carboxyl carrier protein
MPGRVLEIFAKEGDSVEAGSVLLVLEAMKMQNEIRASRAGRVARVAVEPRQAVDGGALMILLEEPNRPDRPVSPPSG